MKSSPESKAGSQSNPKDERLPISRFVLFFVILVVGLAADLITKSVIFSQHFDPNDRSHEAHWWIDGVFGIQTSTNGGALFGLGQGGSMWFAILSIVALLAILFWLFYKRLAHSLWLTITLGIISGGILGNFYDRVGWGYDPKWEWEEIRYHVRDWIHFRLDGIKFFDPWPNFNIADSLLVCGAIMLFLYTFLSPVPQKQADSEKESTNDKPKPSDS